MIKSYRGLMAHDTIETIPLHTNNGKTGYRIKKLQVFPKAPTSTSTEALFQMFTVPQTTAAVETDFTDTTLIAMAYYSASSSSENQPDDMTVIFDNVVFNQDIYLTMRNVQSGNNPLNYYFELEQINLTEDQALVAIVKNLRNEQ